MEVLFLFWGESRQKGQKFEGLEIVFRKALGTRILFLRNFRFSKLLGRDSRVEEGNLLSEFLIQKQRKENFRSF